MIYNLSNNNELKEAQSKVIALAEKGKTIEIKEKRHNRSLSQNAYLHVVITLFAIHFGYTIDEAKTLLKRNCWFMVYEKKGSRYLRLTRSLDSKEMTSFIDWIRNYSANQNHYIPTSEEYLTNRFEIDKEIEKNKEYL